MERAVQRTTQQAGTINMLTPALGTDEQRKDEFSMTQKRVLVADDLAPVLAAVAELLLGSFDVVGMVSDGKAALEAIATLEPDLVVLDISMPGMNGLEVARELQNRGTKSRIVFLSVQEDSGIIAACISAGALGYVNKAVMDSDLILAMNEALEGRVFISRLSS
jgi:DNA-binding NarL/FixJ family response regulator